MKTRIGYVSNSSSSSFIIAYNDKKIEFKSEHGGVISLSPHDFYFYINSLSNSFGDATEIEAVGKDNVLSSINSWSEWSNSGEDYNKDLKELIKKSPEDYITMFSISYHDALPMMLLKALLSDGAIRLLYSSEDREKE
ncbi:MAG: hypothetical protein WCQ80_02580 [Bacilli bacterium]